MANSVINFPGAGGTSVAVVNESIGNTDDTCELTIEGHEIYCPKNPDDPACTEFLHNANNKKPAEVCNSPGGCFKDQDPEKYCLNYNDPTVCKLAPLLSYLYRWPSYYSEMIISH